MRKPSRSALTVLKDIRRDWHGWSGAERFSVKLAGLGIVTLAVLLHMPDYRGAAGANARARITTIPGGAPHHRSRIVGTAAMRASGGAVTPG